MAEPMAHLPTAKEPGADPPTAEESTVEDSSGPPDLRMVLLGAAAWGGALAGFLAPAPLTLIALGAWALLLLVRRLRGRSTLVATGWFFAAAAVACSAMLRAEANQRSPVADLAAEGAYVTATVRVVADPLLRQGRFDPFVLVRARVLQISGRGASHDTRVPVLVIADEAWRGVLLGSTVRLDGRAAPSDGSDLAAVISTSRPPTVLQQPGELLDAAAVVRAGIRAAVAPASPEQRTLIPALVVGDDQGMPDEVVQSFQVAGLTHLLAVSGTNLTLVVGFVLVVARWVGVRAQGLVLVGALGVVGFVLLARTEPSVVRAAAMGSVALVGMGFNGREKGVRALGVAVLALLLFDPWLALSLGFVLSVTATAGILFLAPPWRDALMRWMPRWLAEAIAVPLAAQLACTPTVAAISDQVSLVAVVANMAVAPVVGPATVFGLVAGLSMLLVDPVGLLLGRVAAGCAGWIVAVAEHSARLPTAAVEWSADLGSIAALTVLCLAAVPLMPRLLGRRRSGIALAALMVLAVARPLPTLGWPPDGWVMVACDVGQGDGLVLNAGSGSAVVVDVGADPALIDRCLDRLDVERVPTVVLTHFHEDHAGGLPGVLESRQVGSVEVTGLRDPPSSAAAVSSWAAERNVPLRVPEYGEVRRVGQVRWQVIGPPRELADGLRPSEGSAANNASVAMLVVVRGVRILLTGDMEPEAQKLLDRATTDLRVDVLKVPHHGSRYQDPEFLSGLGARIAVISVGEENEYGHPAPETLAVLQDAGAVVRRTDVSGDVAVVVRDGQLATETSR